MTGVHNHIAEQLQQRGYRYTAVRRRVVDLLASAQRPLTLPEILERDPAMAQSSVYRNLDVLERAGSVTRLSLGDDHARFELAEPLIDHHHHLVCIGCGTVEDVTLDATLERAVSTALERAARDRGFDATHHSLDLHGRCAACA